MQFKEDLKSFKVLSIDGGGIKGLYAARILNSFEKRLRAEHGDEIRIVDFVDMICGTSSGGLIALALSLRIPTDEICKFYIESGSKIFKGSNGIYAKIKQIFWGSKFNDIVLKEELKSIFSDKKIKDSNCLLCIPTFDFTHGTYGIFKFDHKEGNLTRHNQLLMTDVALSTSAAPTYFPLAEIKEEFSTQYIDGGIWANNPSLIGFLEALRYFVGDTKEYNHLNLLSIASLNNLNGQRPLKERERSFLQWIPDIFELSLVGQSEFANIFLSMIKDLKNIPLTYTRIPGASISPKQSEEIKLDLASTKSLVLIQQLANHVFYSIKDNADVYDFFSSKKSYFVN